MRFKCSKKEFSADNWNNFKWPDQTFIFPIIDVSYFNRHKANSNVINEDKNNNANVLTFNFDHYHKFLLHTLKTM